MAAATTISVGAKELIELCALDSSLYCQTFFPATFRQQSPPMHAEIWDLLEDRQHRYAAIEVFRGGAKTTSLRAYTSKRIAYGTSRTILFVSESQSHSEKSIRWLKGQVEKNKTWTGMFGLRKGAKWTDEEIQIVHDQLGFTIAVVAVGITGQTRGLNIDDARPDLIVVDDPCDEENTATPEQRKKISDLFFGALEKSLTPATECPDAKMVLLQTPLDREDLIAQCAADRQWAHRRYGCFDEQGNSRWPQRFPTQTLLDAKAGHIDRGQTALWMREMECLLVAAETCSFRHEWLKYYDELDEIALQRQPMRVFIGLDPVPPPSEAEIKFGLKRKDYEVISAVGCLNEERFLLDLSLNKGHTPDWTVTEFFRMVDKWRPLKARVEGVAYQRTLKWILEKEMAKRGRWVQINACADRRKKQHRIVQAFSGICSAGRFYVSKRHSEFLSQFQTYPNCTHDDVLDSVAMALDEASGMWLDEDYTNPARESGTDFPEDWRTAP